MRPSEVTRSVFYAAAILLAHSSTLHGQVPVGWAQLATEQGAVVGVGARVVAVPGGYQIFFKNFSSRPVHFDFYLSGVQSVDAVPGNGRVHLKAGNPVGPISISVPPGEAPVKLEALNVSVGNEG